MRNAKALMRNAKSMLMRNSKEPTQRPLMEAERKLNSLSNPSTFCCHHEINAFADERMKILYMLSFMSGGMAQVWEANDTSTTLAFNTLEGLLTSIKRPLRPRQGKGWHVPQLYASKWCPGMTTEWIQLGHMPSFPCLGLQRSFWWMSGVLLECWMPRLWLVSLASQTWAFLHSWNDNMYRIFILSSAKALIYMVTAMWMDWTNCSVFSQLPSKVSWVGCFGSSSADLALLISCFGIPHQLIGHSLLATLAIPHQLLWHSLFGCLWHPPWLLCIPRRLASSWHLYVGWGLSVHKHWQPGRSHWATIIWKHSNISVCSVWISWTCEQCDPTETDYENVAIKIGPLGLASSVFIWELVWHSCLLVMHGEESGVILIEADHLWGQHYNKATLDWSPLRWMSWRRYRLMGTRCSGYPQYIANQWLYMRQDFTWAVVIPQRSSWGAPTVQMNYIVTWSNTWGSSPYHSRWGYELDIGNQSWWLLKLDDRVSIGRKASFDWENPDTCDDE